MVRNKRLVSMAMLVFPVLGGGVALTICTATPHATVAASPTQPDSSPVVRPAEEYLFGDTSTCRDIAARLTPTHASQGAMAA
jgi:hypothetical protein